MKTTFVRTAIKMILALMLAGFSAEAQVIVDDGDPGFSASSSWGSLFGGYNGDSRYRITAPVSDPATWKANLPSTGSYAIYAWWVAGANRSSRAPYIVYHGSGSTTVLVNQQINGGKWNLLGTWTMGTGGGQVKLSPWTTTGYIVVADAIKWQ